MSLTTAVEVTGRAASAVLHPSMLEDETAAYAPPAPSAYHTQSDACVCPPETKCVCGEEEVFEEVREAEEQEHEKKLQEEKYKSGYESPALEDLSSEMQYRHLGSSGLKVSALSYGAWVTFGNQLSTDQAFDIMSAAYELGINFFDNAETYASKF